MGHVAAILSRTNDDTLPVLLKMLEAVSPNRGESYGIASDGGVIISDSIRKIKSLGSHIMLGHRLTKIMPNDPPQPLAQYGYPMVFEGRLWSRAEASSITRAADTVGTDPISGIRRLVEQKDGSYVIVIIHEEKIHCGRDHIGVVPLYLGENTTLAGAASSMKMLWAVGLDAKPLPPGHIAEITKQGIFLEPVQTLQQPLLRKMSMGETVEKLDRLLSEVVEARSRGIFNVALGFSGGIDSSLLASYLDKVGVEVELICVGMEGSAEFEAAERSAEYLDLPVRLESFTIEDVDNDLDKVLWSVEDPNPMKVGVALPLHWAVKSAAESGVKVLFSGNGSDELFGGYKRYVREYAESGESVRETLFRDVAASHEVNFERDYKTCMDSGVELRLPFTDSRIIEFGLSLPIELKLPTDPKSPRKRILRTLAEKLGFTHEVAYRPKKAVQYSTGVNKALKRLAKKSGVTLASFLAERFKKVKKSRLRDLMES